MAVRIIRCDVVRILGIVTLRIVSKFVTFKYCVCSLKMAVSCRNTQQLIDIMCMYLCVKVIRYVMDE